MKETVVTVYSEFDQISEFCKFAVQYHTDFFKPNMRHFLTDTFPETFDFVVSKYHLEEGEQIYRPMYFVTLGGDCDDSTIFWVGLLLASGFPEQKIFICEAKDSESDYFTHIFCAFVHQGKLIYLDNLPGSQFGVIPYRGRNLRVTPLTDYL